MDSYDKLVAMRDALRRYANHRPLDLLSPAEIQRDLLAISGKSHKYAPGIDMVNMECLLCGRGKDNAVHFAFASEKGD